MEPRAFTANEVSDMMLDHIHHLVAYWSQLPNMTAHERCEGVAFSILVMLDGESHLPGVTMRLNPHPDDKAYFKENGDNWFEDIEISTALHEHFLKDK